MNNCGDRSQETKKSSGEKSSSKIKVLRYNRAVKRHLNEPSSTAKEFNSLEYFEDELQCAICKEIFIHPLTLSCTHTFCKYCIEQWRQNHSCCPICRSKITAQFRTRVLDNFIEKILKKADDEVKQHRREVIAQRQTVSSISVWTSSRRTDYGLINFSSEDTSEEEGDYGNSLSDDAASMSERDFDADRHRYSRYNRYYGQRSCCTSPRGHWDCSYPYKKRRFR